MTVVTTRAADMVDASRHLSELASELSGRRQYRLDHRFRETDHIQRLVIPGRRVSAGHGIHNHSPGLWIPGSRAEARAPE